MQEGLTALFFVSYVLVVGVVLMNIVVAVLLDEFISTVAREKQETLREEEQRGHAHNEPHSVPRDPRPETLHPTPYTLHPTPCILNLKAVRDSHSQARVCIHAGRCWILS